MDSYIIHFTKSQQQILLPLLESLDIGFEKLPEDNKSEINPKEIANAFKNCVGIWKDREELQDLKSFRKTLWRKNPNL